MPSKGKTAPKASGKAKGKSTRSMATRSMVTEEPGQPTDQQDKSQEVTEYDRILSKVQENRRKRAAPGANEQEVSVYKEKKKKGRDTTIMETAFREDDNFVDMLVENPSKEFPTPSEEEDNNSDSETEEGEIDKISRNNNASRSTTSRRERERSAVRSRSATPRPLPDYHDVEPTTSDGRKSEMDSKLSQRMSKIQAFMVKKGLITDEELSQLLEDGDDQEPDQLPVRDVQPVQRASRLRDPLTKRKADPPGKEIASLASSSDMTIYKRAVQQIAPEFESQIDQFINDARKSQQGRKESSSSDELMDTSDEADQLTNQFQSLTARAPQPQKTPQKDMTPDEEAAENTRESEMNKGVMYEVPGRSNPNSLLEIDNDYQMLSSHLDDSMRKKILTFEYIDFARLLPKNRVRDDDQRMEIVNRNGMTYLSPVSDREATSVNNYNKWEQAFRIYSNVLTSTYPQKSTELLQYNHTIHTAATSYIWENVYNYDKEFRQHIARHPTRVWNVILQQAWTMILKDRLRSDGGHHDQRGGRVNKRDPYWGPVVMVLCSKTGGCSCSPDGIWLQSPKNTSKITSNHIIRSPCDGSIHEFYYFRHISMFY